MNNTITMADIARIAGVSLMTVSRVINHKDGVSQETRQRVEEIIRDLGYRPSGIARSLATQRTGTLGLVVPDISNPFFSGVAAGVEQAARAEGFSLLLCNTEEDKAREIEMLEVLEEKRVDGVLLCSSRLDQKTLKKALARHPAAVLMNRRLNLRSNDAPISSVVFDDEAGGKMATLHLLGLDRKRVGLLSGPPASFSGQSRMRGYRAALEITRTPFDPHFVRSCIPTVQGGFQATRELLLSQPTLDALFCFNDLVAVGAIQACLELGYTVPDQIAIAGYDDILLAALITPPLTTCYISRTDMGVQATRLLLDRINGCAGECQNIVLQPKLIVRASAPHA